MAHSIIPLLRRLVRSPGFSAVTVLTLAIGIGATAALFGVVNGVLLKPLPYPEPERLVGVWQTAPGLNVGQVNASPSTYFTYREESRTFSDIGVWNSGSSSVTGLAEPEQIPALYVSDGLLPILGVGPLHGRLFSREDDQPKAAGTAILTHGYWRRRFGSDARAVGRMLRIDGDSYTIIGVMPEHFRFLDRQASLILPIRFDRGKAFLEALARLFQCRAEGVELHLPVSDAGTKNQFAVAHHIQGREFLGQMQWRVQRQQGNAGQQAQLWRHQGDLRKVRDLLDELERVRTVV